MNGCKYDHNEDGDCHIHPSGCPPEPPKQQSRLARGSMVEGCRTCSPKQNELPHPVGVIYVGWGDGFQPCPTCQSPAVISKLSDPDDHDDVMISAEDISHVGTTPVPIDDDQTGKVQGKVEIQEEITFPAPPTVEVCQMCATSFAQHRQNHPLSCSRFKRMTQEQKANMFAPLIEGKQACPICRRLLVWGDGVKPSLGDWCEACLGGATLLLTANQLDSDTMELAKGRDFRKFLASIPELVNKIRGA